MARTQYSRNLEDVLILRALARVAEGTFLDVGAGHPVYDSNTYALYRRGWRGIALEPLEEAAPLWRRERPEDLLIAMAAAASPGERILYVPPDAAQMSTLDASYALERRLEGFPVTPRRVPATTLNEVLDRFHEGDLHLMSLDAEGAEPDVLGGLDLARYRPWLMVIEAIHPKTAQPTHETWEPHVLSAGYGFVYFDGCNRFYLAGEHAGLKVHFASPPGPEDEFLRFEKPSA